MIRSKMLGEFGTILSEEGLPESNNFRNQSKLIFWIKKKSHSFDWLKAKDLTQGNSLGTLNSNVRKLWTIRNGSHVLKLVL